MIYKIFNKVNYWFSKYILSNKLFAMLFLKPFIIIHSHLYHSISVCASVLNDGIHPKHKILKYKEWFLDHLESEDVILDIGCNTGMMPGLFSKKVKYVYGIEINSKLIDKAKRENQYQNIEYICADATTYDYSNCRPVSCITMSNVLEHIEHREEFLRKLITAVKKKSQKKIRILIRVPMINRDWLTVYRKNLGMEYRLDPGHFTEYTCEQFKDEMTAVGVKIKDTKVMFGELYAVCSS